MSTQGLAKKTTFQLTAYDILGYLVPGGGTLLIIFLFEFWARHVHDKGKLGAEIHTPIRSVIRLFDISLTDSSWVLGAIFLAVILAFAYVVGHVVATISALIFDRTLIEKGHGYPYVGYLKIKPDSHAQFSKNFYRGIMFYLTAYLLIRYLEITQISPIPGKILIFFLDFLEWTIAVILLIKFFLGIPGVYSWISKWTWPRKFIDAVFWAFAVFYNTLSYYLEKILNTNKVFDVDFRTKYVSAFKDVFDFDPNKSGSNNYWLSMLYVRDHHPAFAEMASNWLRLYSFARNLSGALFLAFVYQFFWVYLQKDSIIGNNNYQVKVLLVLPVGVLLASLIMVLRYRFLYSDYYTKFIFRSFVYLSEARREDPYGDDSD